MKTFLTRAAAALAMAMAMALPLQFAQAADKPNILVIWGDDIGQCNISAYNLGMMGYQMPNIDRTSTEGIG